MLENTSRPRWFPQCFQRWRLLTRRIRFRAAWLLRHWVRLDRGQVHAASKVMRPRARTLTAVMCRYALDWSRRESIIRVDLLALPLYWFIFAPIAFIRPLSMDSMRRDAPSSIRYASTTGTTALFAIPLLVSRRWPSAAYSNYDGLTSRLSTCLFERINHLARLSRLLDVY